MLYCRCDSRTAVRRQGGRSCCNKCAHRYLSIGVVPRPMMLVGCKCRRFFSRSRTLGSRHCEIMLAPWLLCQWCRLPDPLPRERQRTDWFRRPPIGEAVSCAINVCRWKMGESCCRAPRGPLHRKSPIAARQWHPSLQPHITLCGKFKGHIRKT